MSGSSGKSHWGLALLLVVLLLLVGGLLRGGMLRVPGGRVYGAPKVPLSIATNFSPVSLGSFQNGFSSVIDPALPAVVNISSTSLIKKQANMPGFFNDPFFRQFFGDQFPAPSATPQMERQYSLGSGVIVNSNGYILTNNHVVSGATDVEVFTQERQRFKAKVIGTDPNTDIAVLKIDDTGMTTLTLGDSSRLKVGDLVFAIGDPFGVGETATSGIVSATGRALGGTIEHYEDFIQTDSAINPGNSGGALIDAHGNLIGINTAIISGGGGGNQGIGFAIPIAMARNVMEQIVDHGKVIRGYLGVTIQAVSPEMADAFGLTRGGGALIGDVTPNSPAAKAGIERGDIVLELNGQAVNGPDDLSVRISEMAPGATVHLKIFRNGQNRDVDVTLGEYPQNAASTQPAAGVAASTLKGLQVQNLTPDLAQQFSVPPSTAGVVVTSVDPASAAATAGVQAGDVIQDVNRKPVNNTEQYEQALQGKTNQAVLLLLNRKGTTHFVVVEPE
ncbi:MAG TPA: Do family serine endopeptidase [Candidatus Acidoferrales bacterium]|jgi:serine protease Do|nr:Do family serine endopeptidase [Candidatus Acidoferrales bacterium]